MKLATRTGRQSGFTLIELLVVIGIIGVLAAALLPRILESQRDADILADQRNLSWHYENHLAMKNRKMSYEGGGHKMVLAPWVKGICDHTEANRDRFFTPGIMQNDERWKELRQEDPTKIWQRFEDLSSEDTQYAGRAQEHLRTMWRGNEALMANDNEVDKAFSDGTINVLLGSGSVKMLLKAEDLQEFWPEDDPDFVLEVGPNSPVAMLRKLER